MGLPTRYNGYQNWSAEITATAASGSGFTALPNIPCDEVVIYNPASGVALDVKNSNETDATKYVTVDAPAGAVIPVSGTAAEIEVRRHDQSATPVTVRFIWRKFRR